MRGTVTFGALLSTSGTYRHMGRNALAGIEHAVAEINRSQAFDFDLRLRHLNPEGRLERYAEALGELHREGLRHVFGPITSASRKELIPDLEQRGTLLWYPCPYEGFESSENVLYLGGCPNQTLIPLLRHALQAFGRQAYLIGSNYVWGWESNRIAREVLGVAQGEVLGEKYFHLGAIHFAEVVEALLQAPPAFILNNLVGDSSHAFLRQLDAACLARGLSLPVLSCNLTEGELVGVGEMRALRLLSCGPFFEEVDPAFSQRQRRLHGLHPYSHYYACAYAAVHLFAVACQRSGDDTPEAVCQALYAAPVATILGELRIAAQNNHACLPSYIAELKGKRFSVLEAETLMQEADPYLTATDLEPFRAAPGTALRPHLRIIR
ncbi:transporter substrate-binding protein [Pseudomonas kuykendallii]|uniref:transporter substrate-binding protein n=1 Tax=Pseudomonas kuykendallii TaxID=1007099 RepID=UPI0028D335AA|nr:transporter substrate-binding protein [Pseudomonas kuykendallii]